ncbi:TetR/AcrR family transcriptional regulator [Zavarzinia sp. CC-PAN008]|uniref:TetR/AcrR family transcriptional regulator n=1 Tax=Zavarzinia sp. CC-PAN008 TaxID=3243332 RepID=UPI003F74A0BE
MSPPAAAAPKAVPSKADLKAEITNLKRERIMEAATALFAANGFHGTSMDAIAEALGVTKPFIYYHFKDKGEVLTAICRRGADLTLSAIKSAEAEPASATDRLLQFVRAMADIILDHEHFLTVYSRETGNLSEAARREIMRMRAEIDARVMALITAGQASGEFNVADPQVTAHSVTGVVNFLQVWYRPRGPEARAHAVETVADLVQRMVGQATWRR